jgi:hypothetical protein
VKAVLQDLSRGFLAETDDALCGTSRVWAMRRVGRDRSRGPPASENLKRLYFNSSANVTFT